MKIAYLCGDRGIPVGGRKAGSVHIQAIVEALRAQGHDVRIVATAAASTVDVVPMTVVETPAVVDLLDDGSQPRVARALAHVLTNVAVHDVLAGILPNWRPDVLYERLSPFGIAGSVIARRLNLVHVLEVNALLAEEGARFRKQALPDAAAYLEQATLRAASAVVVVSDALAAKVGELGVRAERVSVVPNGVDQTLFAPQGPVAPLPRGRTTVGFVGSLKPWHGVEVLLAAFETLISDARFHLIVVGDGPGGGALQRFADAHPNDVTWIRDLPHEEVPAYVRAMDIAVAPYPAMDAFYFSPLKVLEYMAAGRPVVASRIGQLADVIRHDDTGHLVAPGDASALVAAIRALAGDDARRAALGARAAAEIRARHLWSHRAADLADLFGSLLAHAHPWHRTGVGA